MLDGLRDIYHGLLIGPCDADTVAKETACRLVEAICMPDEDGFDCSYPEWAEMFRAKVHRLASTDAEETMPPEAVLSKRQTKAAARAQESGEPLVLDDRHRAERREGGWVVINHFDHFLESIEDPSYLPEDDDPNMPPLKFPTPEEAMIGWLRSQQIAKARSERCDASLKLLGRE